jgi:hypothetical protein
MGSITVRNFISLVCFLAFSSIFSLQQAFAAFTVTIDDTTETPSYTAAGFLTHSGSFVTDSSGVETLVFTGTFTKPSSWSSPSGLPKTLFFLDGTNHISDLVTFPGNNNFNENNNVITVNFTFQSDGDTPNNNTNVIGGIYSNPNQNNSLASTVESTTAYNFATAFPGFPIDVFVTSDVDPSAPKADGSAPEPASLAIWGLLGAFGCAIGTSRRRRK